jgi:cytidylate kinase
MINIAIDGYAGCGKSTLAKDLAQALGFVFIDSGAMYRGVTLYFLDQSVDIQNLSAVRAGLAIMPSLEFTPGENRLLLGGLDVESRIRGEQAIANRVSDVAALPDVREHLKGLQQARVAEKGVVMEGRDIGTVIMPQAELKLFITASMDERVRRRMGDLTGRGEVADEEQVRMNLSERDRKDATRTEAPLRKAEDAIVLDTTDLDREQQLKAAIALARPLMNPGLLPFIR